jgi:thioredoxin-related protein
MQKYVIALLFIIISTTLTAQQIDWTSMNTALDIQQKKPKKIMLFVYAEWCKECHKMNETTFVNKDVAKYINKNFYAVHFNGEGTEKVNYKGFEYTNPNYVPDQKGQNYQHFFADALKIKAYPTIVFFDEEGEIISPIEGFKSAKDLEIFLKMIASNDYLEVKTYDEWEAYQKDFKPSFKVY